MIVFDKNYNKINIKMITRKTYKNWNSYIRQNSNNLKIRKMIAYKTC